MRVIPTREGTLSLMLSRQWTADEKLNLRVWNSKISETHDGYGVRIILSDLRLRYVARKRACLCLYALQHLTLNSFWSTFKDYKNTGENTSDVNGLVSYMLDSCIFDNHIDAMYAPICVSLFCFSCVVVRSSHRCNERTNMCVSVLLVSLFGPHIGAMSAPICVLFLLFFCALLISLFLLLLVCWTMLF